MNLSRRISILSGLLATALLATAAPAAARAAAQPSERDTAWIVAAHQANLAEIATGKMAQEKGTSAVVKELGERFVTDHTKLDAALRPLASELNVALPDKPTAEQQAVAQRLSDTAVGADFDKLWIEQQLAAHAKSMQATQQEIDSGDAARVKQVAEAALPVIKQHHEALMKAAPAFGLPQR
ncbi:DUF4142 domain-containing protein [Catellatospora sp. NPDC049609]|uniref:DUF4142 domain-containing protein n=1 Tax=Catellatospora sp. NPDC049609 TaxID=3155505 RepID=UPI00343AB865